MNKLNPEWNEKFRLIVKDPETQALELQLYDWDKVFPSAVSFGSNTNLLNFNINPFDFVISCNSSAIVCEPSSALISA